MSSWVDREPTKSDAFKLILLFVALNFLISTLSVLTLQFANVPLSEPIDVNALLSLNNWPILILNTVIVEEALFRLPLAIFIVLRSSKRVIWTVAIVSSLLFGYFHGGFANIFIQGIGGFIFCIVFLKFAMEKRKIMQGLLAAIITHALFDFISLILILVT